MADGGGVMLIDARDGKWRVAYPGSSPRVAHDAKYAACATAPDPAKLQTHGLNLLPGRNGHSTLYAVAHGARESIEVFDVDASTQGAEPVLTWKGCVPMPEGLAANSVASFEDGSLVATVLLMPGKTFADSIAKRPTGAEKGPMQFGIPLGHKANAPYGRTAHTTAFGRRPDQRSGRYRNGRSFEGSSTTSRRHGQLGCP